MPKIINILTIIDAERVLQDHPHSLSQPVELKNNGKGYTYMLTEWADTDQYQGLYYFYKVDEQDQEQGGYTLNVVADPGDILRWRLIALTSPLNYQCYLYNLYGLGGWLDITPPQPKSIPVTCAIIDPSARTSNSIIPVKKNDFWWESTVTKPHGHRQAYNLIFSIADSDGIQIGQFSSDPYVNAIYNPNGA